MPSPTAVIGAYLTAYVPDDTQAIALGYTTVRFYAASSENGAYSLVGTASLVAATRDYSYNHTVAAATDWWKWALYSVANGEGPQSEPMPVGPPQTTRLQVRQGVGKRLRMMELLTATGTSATVFTAPELIDAGRSVHTVGNKWCRPTAGSYTSPRRVLPGATGYTNRTTGEVTVGRTFGGTLAASTEVELWAGRGETDPSGLVDDAMQRAREQLWWEDTWYFSTDADVSDYYVPAVLLAGSIKAVDYAGDTYPSKPNWRPVGWWDLAQDSQTPLLTVLASAVGHAMYEAGKVIRVKFNRFADRMDSDSDYFGVALEWAIAEAALQYLQAQLVPTGSKEDTQSAAAAASGLQAECIDHRRTYMPSAPNPRTRIAR